MTAHEIQADAIYVEAYKAAEKAFNKKYNKLLLAAAGWVNLYAESFGEPDSCREFYDLRNILVKEKILSHLPTSV